MAPEMKESFTSALVVLEATVSGAETHMEAFVEKVESGKRKLTQPFFDRIADAKMAIIEGGAAANNAVTELGDKVKELKGVAQKQIAHIQGMAQGAKDQAKLLKDKAQALADSALAPAKQKLEELQAERDRLIAKLTFAVSRTVGMEVELNFSSASALRASVEVIINDYIEKQTAFIRGKQTELKEQSNHRADALLKIAMDLKAKAINYMALTSVGQAARRHFHSLPGSYRRDALTKLELSPLGSEIARQLMAPQHAPKQVLPTAKA